MEPSDKKSAKTARLPPEGSGQTPARETVALEKLVTDAGTQVRAEISEYIVGEYLDAIGEGARFPPVVVFRGKGADVLADGFHRVRAYQQAGRSEIEADVYQGNWDDALWFALGGNRAHGQRLSGEDKQRAIEIAYRTWPEVSQTRMAAHVGCSQPYVGRVRAQLKPRFKLPDRVVGSDGRERPATRPSTSRQGARAEDNAAPATQNQRPSKGSDSPEQTVSTDGGTYPAERNRRDSRPEEGIEPATETPDEEHQTEDAATPKSPSAKRNKNDKPSRGARERSNRIVAIVASDAQNLTAQEELIDFRVLDREKLPEWIADLKNAQQNLGRLIRRLQKEMTDGSDPSTA